MWGGGVWGSAAFDPAPEAVPAPAPYPDGTYAMTPSQFDAQVESWTAKQADFDASLRQDRAFVQLTRQREIRAAGAAAFVALLPLTSVFSALTALPVAPHADPAARALALHGACDRWAGAPVTGGDLAWEEETFRGVDVKAAEVERLALRVATTLLVVAAAVALGIAYGVCARAASVMRRAATFRDANARVSSGKKNETAPREISTDALETPARVSPPPPPPPPAPRRPGSLGPLSRPPDLRIFADDTKTKPHPPPPPPPPRTPRGGSLTTETSSSPASALRRSLAMGKLRRAVSSRANARLREVNAAANEAPTPEVARRVKTRLDPSDVLAELRAKSPFLAEASREARAHARAIASLREALERLDGTASPSSIEALRDRAEAVLAEITDEPRVLRLLEFPEARLESLRVAAANAAALRERRARAESLTRLAEAAPPSRAGDSSGALFLDHARALAALDACVSAADGVDAARAADERRFRDAGIAFDWRATNATREAAVAMCGARLRSALARCAAAREREARRVSTESKENDVFVFDDFRGDNRDTRAGFQTPQNNTRFVCSSGIPFRAVSALDARGDDVFRSREDVTRRVLPESGALVDALRARDVNGTEVGSPLPIARKPNRTASAENKPPRTASTRCPSRVDARRPVSDAALNLWVLRSACDLAYRAYAACGGVDAATDAAAAEAEVEIAAFDEEAWREAEIVAARAAAAARVRSY